jgi:hypothetical protein
MVVIPHYTETYGLYKRKSLEKAYVVLLRGAHKKEGSPCSYVA